MILPDRLDIMYVRYCEPSPLYLLSSSVEMYAHTLSDAKHVTEIRKKIDLL